MDVQNLKNLPYKNSIFLFAKKMDKKVIINS